MCFKHSSFPSAPVAELANYETFVLQYLPQLTKLDTQIITDEERQKAKDNFSKLESYGDKIEIDM